MVSIPNELLGHLARREVILFVGAGLSVNAGLPNWAELFHPVALAIGMNWPSSSEITTDYLLTVAQYYDNKLGRNNLIRHLRNNLRSNNSTSLTAHLLLAQLPSNLIYTTNYDELLELALRQSSKQYHVIVSEPELAYWNPQDVQVVKLCGDLKNPDSIVVTKRDFNIYSETHRRLIEQLRTTLETHTALFLGYSLRDPFLNQIWDTIRLTLGDHQRLGYSVMFDGQDLEVDDLKRRGITAVLLHADSTDMRQAVFQQFLRDLVRLTT